MEHSIRHRQDQEWGGGGGGGWGGGFFPWNSILRNELSEFFHPFLFSLFVGSTERATLSNHYKGNFARLSMGDGRKSPFWIGRRRKRDADGRAAYLLLCISKNPFTRRIYPPCTIRRIVDSFIRLINGECPPRYGSRRNSNNNLQINFLRQCPNFRSSFDK